MKKVLSVLLCISLIIAVIPLGILDLNVSAATIWNTIPSDNYVYDTMTYNGITTNALFPKSSTMYSGKYDSDSTYSCAALPVRFFKNYGISIRIPGSGIPSVLDGSGNFIQVTKPQIGDVLRKPGVHWAIVKAVNGNTITVFEQNYWWNNNGTWKAGKNRTISQTDIDNGTWVLYRCTSFNSSNSGGTTDTSSITIENTGVESITNSNAFLKSVIYKPASSSLQRVGVKIRQDGRTYTEEWKFHKQDAASAWTGENEVSLTWDLTKECGYKLIHATKYYYKMYAIVDGVEYWSEENSFTTTGSHSYGSWNTTTAATCTGEGVQTRTCACGKKETKSISMLDHEYEANFTVDKEATCAETGSKSRHCIRCSAKTEVTEIPKEEIHSISDFDWIIEPTCTQDGVCNVICNFCGVILENVTYVDSALGHTASGSYIISNNYHYEKCIVCGEKYSQQSHNLDDDNICIICGYFCEHVIAKGDLSGDSDINNRDLALLMQHLNGWPVEITEEAADVNADSTVNNRDYAILMQYINGWPVELK